MLYILAGIIGAIIGGFPAYYLGKTGGKLEVLAKIQELEEKLKNPNR